jgi:hypothetical protein
VRIKGQGGGRGGMPACQKKHASPGLTLGRQAHMKKARSARRGASYFYYCSRARVTWRKTPDVPYMIIHSMPVIACKIGRLQDSPWRYFESGADNKVAQRVLLCTFFTCFKPSSVYPNGIFSPKFGVLDERVFDDGRVEGDVWACTTGAMEPYRDPDRRRRQRIVDRGGDEDRP